MSAFLNLLFSASASIATLLSVAIGLAIIFGLMGIVNMAHGEFLMIGAFTVVALVRSDVMSIWLAMLCAPVVAGAVGAVVERLLIRPLYGRRLLDTLLVTFGLSLVLFQLAVIIFGTTPPGISTPLGSFSIGGYNQPIYTVFRIVATVLLVVCVYLIFTRTRYGVVARAAAEKPEMASALGVNTSRVNMYTFMLGSALAGAAGALLAPTIGVKPAMGQDYIGQAFMTVVTGGGAVLTGTSAAAVLLGGISSGFSLLFSSLWGLASILAVAIVVLRFAPRGLSGNWGRNL